MVSIVIAFIRLIRGFIEESRVRAMYRGMYAGCDTPKTLGTKIRG